MTAAVLSVLLMAGSQILFKSSMRRLRCRHHGERIPLFSVLLYPRVLVALSVNVIAALLWIWALRELEISYVYPLLCLNYLLVPVGAWWVLGEPVERRRWLAIGVICTGVVLCLISGPPR